MESTILTGVTVKSIDRAISIRQPYAELILRGEKRKEYRSRLTNIRERVYIYAAMKPGEQKFWSQVQKKPGDLTTNRIVGSVEIVDCILTKYGNYAYVLANPKRLRVHLHALNQPQPCFWHPAF